MQMPIILVLQPLKRSLYIYIYNPFFFVRYTYRTMYRWLYVTLSLFLSGKGRFFIGNNPAIICQKKIFFFRETGEADAIYAFLISSRKRKEEKKGLPCVERRSTMDRRCNNQAIRCVFSRNFYPRTRMGFCALIEYIETLWYVVYRGRRGGNMLRYGLIDFYR